MKKILLLVVLFIFSVFLFMGCDKEETQTGDPAIEPSQGDEPLEEVKYIVTFDIEGKKETAIVKDGEKIAKPNDPVKDGFVFLGWYLGEEQELTTLYNFDTAVKADITLTAKFEQAKEPTPEVKYIVTFDVDGSKEVVEVKEGEKVSKPNDPVKDGFVFLGWYLGEEQELTTLYDFEASVTSDITLIAKFEEEIQLTPYEQLEKAAESVVFPEVIRDNIELPTEVLGFKAEWASDNKKVLTKDGVYTYVSENTEVTLSLTLIYGDDEEFFDKEFIVIVGPYEDAVCVEYVASAFEFAKEIKANKIKLPVEFEYGVSATWKSESEIINVETGDILTVEAPEIVKLAVTFQKGESTHHVSLTVLVQPYKGITSTAHNIIDKAKDFTGTFNDVELKDGKVVLAEGATEGTYTSVEFDTLPFEEVVGTWNCITSTEATAELKVSVCVNGTWSMYFSYGEWGLGKENYYYNQSDSLVKMSVDEIIVLNGKQADKIKYTVTLKRDSANTPSPELSMVTFALSMEAYTYEVDVTGLPTSADWDVPKLYQHDVNVVGSVICSATTTTMLLKYKGHDFSEQAKTYKNVAKWGVYEHGYMASLVADPGHNSPTYGNWTYNMVTAGAFGETAYVARMYSWNEMKYYLANYGPLGVSIGGYFGAYTTNGHLIVVRGYKEVNGETTVVCNDPNIYGVYYEVSLSIFMNAWHRNGNSGVVYIVE